jgi:methionyl-tRNA formyltransferase
MKYNLKTYMSTQPMITKLLSKVYKTELRNQNTRRWRGGWAQKRRTEDMDIGRERTNNAFENKVRACDNCYEGIEG